MVIILTKKVLIYAIDFKYFGVGYNQSRNGLEQAESFLQAIRSFLQLFLSKRLSFGVTIMTIQEIQYAWPLMFIHFLSIIT